MLRFRLLDKHLYFHTRFSKRELLLWKVKAEALPPSQRLASPWCRSDCSCHWLGCWTERPNDPVNGPRSPAQHGPLPAIVSAAFSSCFTFYTRASFIGWKLFSPCVSRCGREKKKEKNRRQWIEWKAPCSKYPTLSPKWSDGPEGPTAWSWRRRTLSGGRYGAQRGVEGGGSH